MYIKWSLWKKLYHNIYFTWQTETRFLLQAYRTCYFHNWKIEIKYITDSELLIDTVWIAHRQLLLYIPSKEDIKAKKYSPNKVITNKLYPSRFHFFYINFAEDFHPTLLYKYLWKLWLWPLLIIMKTCINFLVQFSLKVIEYLTISFLFYILAQRESQSQPLDRASYQKQKLQNYLSMSHLHAHA